MSTLLHTSTSLQAVVAVGVSVVPLSTVAVVVSLNVVLPVAVAVVLVTLLLLLLHCFSIVHTVWKQLELEIPSRDVASEDDALDPSVEDDLKSELLGELEVPGVLLGELVSEIKLEEVEAGDELF